MTLASGTKLGPLEIVGQLGKGGMGEVYRARDSRLQREVAVKVLPAEFSANAERVLRFRREAEILAALNHPHIAAIYDVSDSGDYRFLVMELVEGETLAERLAHGPMSLPELFKTAIQIAEALEAAHEKDIVHRDLKPPNIKLDSNGSVKVLDFGLARTTSQSSNSSNSPTMVTVETERALLGTAAYMAPEQARGKDAGRASDVWAFGCVLYEMLTGKMAFDGENTAEILAGVLKSEPDWNALPSNTPEGLRRLLRRCLQKDVRSRFHDMSDVRIELIAAQSEPSIEQQIVKNSSRSLERTIWIAALALTAVAVGFYFNRGGVPTREIYVDISTPPTSQPASIALSLDGQKLVFVSNDGGRSKLWVRLLDSSIAKPLGGTDFATLPFWSPDGNSIGFFADEKLKRIDLSGGTPMVLANAPIPRGGAWSADGSIFFAPMAAGPLYRVSANGGQPAAVTQLMPNQRNHRFPQMLPDGRILYVAFGDADSSGPYVAQPDGSDARRLGVRFDTAFAPTGHLLFLRGNTLLAQVLDLKRLQLAGEPFLVAENVATGSFRNVGASASADGLILYRPISGEGRRQLVWFDRSGKELQRIGTPDDALAMNPSLSPDGRRVALHRGPLGTDVWVLELGRDVFTRLTLAPETDVYPIWSPDGKSIVFASNRKGIFNLYEKPSGASGNDNVFLETEQNKTPTDWSPDGKFILFQTLDLETNDDIWALPMSGERKPFSVVQTRFAERDAQFSADGHWIAYQSNESGRFEIYVQSFPNGSVKTQITNQGGAQVRWRRDGKELFYIAPDGRLIAIPIRLPSSIGQVEVGAETPLFVAPVGDAIQGTDGPHYAVSPDGTRFLINTLVEEQAAPLTLIVNWKGRTGSR